MSRQSPVVVELDAHTSRTLESRARRYTLPYREVIRAQLVLLAAEGLDNDDIAARLNTRREVVSKWRKRFFEEGLAGLEERPRRGRPARFSPPASRLRSRPSRASCRRRWACRCRGCRCPTSQAEVLRRGLVAEISETTIWRWLSDDAIAPWRHRSWIFPRDPDLEAKAGRVLDLYAGRFEGRRLGRGEYVLSADDSPDDCDGRAMPTTGRGRVDQAPPRCGTKNGMSIGLG